jgi:hypothetical protein
VQGCRFASIFRHWKFVTNRRVDKRCFSVLLFIFLFNTPPIDQSRVTLWRKTAQVQLRSKGFICGPISQLYAFGFVIITEQSPSSNWGKEEKRAKWNGMKIKKNLQ